MLKKLIHTFLNFLFPQKCVGCGIKNEILCNECLTKIDYPDGAPRQYIFAAAAYHDAYVKKTIWLLKYRGVKLLAKPMAELITRRIFKNNVRYKNYIIIPIPLSKKRLRERGFNQSELIAKHIAAKMSIMIKTDVLYKKIHTESQVSIKDRAKRLNNIKGSFAVKNREAVKNKNIILIDDVCTTGATISEARKVLREAGAKKIIGAVVARG